MRVQFSYSQEDIVDASLRFHVRSRVISRMQRSLKIWVGLLAGLFVLFLFRFSFRGLIAGTVAAIIAVLIYPWIYQYEQRKSLRRLIKENYGDEKAFACQVELLPQWLKTNTANVEATFPWETVEEIVETSDSVDI